METCLVVEGGARNVRVGLSSETFPRKVFVNPKKGVDDLLEESFMDVSADPSEVAVL